MGFAQLKVCDLWGDFQENVQEDSRFYLYGLFRFDKPDLLGNYDFEPFYFGKGCDDRYLDHRREANRLKDSEEEKNLKNEIIHELWDKGLDFKEMILFDNLIEEEAFKIEKKKIKEYGRINNGTGCLANLSDGGEGPSKSREDFLRGIRKRFGDIAYDLFVNYLDDPLIIQADISEYTGLTHEGVRYLLWKIHGDNVWRTKSENFRQEKLSCYPSNLQGLIGDKLRKERIKHRKDKCRWECENSKTFTVKKLILHKQSGLYTLSFYVKSDYIVTSKDNDVYLIPFPNIDSERIYLHYPQDLEQYKDFSFLKNIDLDGNEIKSICKLELNEVKIEKDIPDGYCHCGCGQKTNIIKANNKNKGQIKGEPYKYLGGHNKNKSLDKLSENDIEDFIKMYNDNISVGNIAEKYNVSWGTVQYHLKKTGCIKYVEEKIANDSPGEYSLRLKEFLCSVCGNKILRKRKVKNVICLNCKVKQKK